VGYTDPVPGGVSHAFVYNPGIGFTQLNLAIPSNSGWSNLTEATAINNAGQIVGYGTNPQGQTDAFLLTPVVPEPSASCLLLLAASGILSARRRHP
jgi:probable HAF family extracellular repeat protein